MSNRDIYLEALEFGKKTGADHVEVFFNKSKTLEVVIEKNDLQVPKGDKYQGIGVRIFKNGKIGFASTNLLTTESIQETVRSALDLAENSPADPDQGLPEPMPLKEVEGIFDPRGESVVLADLINKGNEFMEQTRGTDSRVTIDTASFKAEIIERAIVNTRGIQAEEKKTKFESVAMGFARDGEDVSSFDLEYLVTPEWEKLKTGEIGERLRKKVVGNLGAETIPGFKGSVILSPFAAVMLLFSPIVFGVNADNVQNGISPWREKMGQKVSSEFLSIEDDGSLPGEIGSKMFDREGISPQRLEVISNGKLNAWLHNYYTASKAGEKPTGHASGGDQSLPGIGPNNFIIKPGQESLDEIINSIDRGLIVTRYSGGSDPVSGDFSGVVKGGYLIEKGKDLKPVKEVMIAGNVYKLLHQLLALSNETQRVMNFNSPYVAIEGVSVTGK